MCAVATANGVAAEAQDRMWHINTKISARQTSAQGSVSSLFVTSCLPGEIFTRHCASTVKHGIFNAHIRISRFLVRTSFEDHIKIPPSQIRDPKSPVGSLRGNFLVCRTCPLEASPARRVRRLQLFQIASSCAFGGSWPPKTARRLPCSWWLRWRLCGAPALCRWLAC